MNLWLRFEPKFRNHSSQLHEKLQQHETGRGKIKSTEQQVEKYSFYCETLSCKLQENTDELFVFSGETDGCVKYHSNML